MASSLADGFGGAVWRPRDGGLSRRLLVPEGRVGGEREWERFLELELRSLISLTCSKGKFHSFMLSSFFALLLLLLFISNLHLGGDDYIV